MFLILIFNSVFAGFVPLDRPYTSKNIFPQVLEYQNRSQIKDTGNVSYIFPSNTPLKTGNKLFGNNRLVIKKSNNSIGLLPLIDLEYRYLDMYKDHVKAISAGGILYGNISNLTFMTDARMFSEFRSNTTPYSFDREFIEAQNEGDNSTATFTSYSRYRANINLELPLGNLGYSRSSLHWGPGLFHNLVFHQNAVPFHHFYYKGEIGPIRVMTVWGTLAIDGDSFIRYSDSTRSVYAHRYEWNITPDLLFGISEQLILYNMEEPAAFIPIVPLFMEKGQGLEESNNGNIAFDISYRFNNIGNIYTEFLIDDLSEPASLFNDFWKNKWAWMCGAHIIKDVNKIQLGYITEYSRVEPWIYTHYVKNTAQSANHGYPLGNQLGPNSQAYTHKVYFRHDLKWYVGARLDLVWKGVDYGSLLDDYRADWAKQNDGSHFSKKFISGVDEPELWFELDFSYSLKYCTLHLIMQKKDDLLDFYFQTQLFF